MSILLENHTLNEKLQGLLADALKNPSNIREKAYLMKYCREQDIDFSRSLDKAVKIRKITDPVLKYKPNIIIGVVIDDNDTPRLTAWSNRDNKIVTGVRSSILKDGQKVKMQHVSWKTWIDYCDEFWIISKSQNNLSDLPRYKKRASEDDESTNESYINEKVTGRIADVLKDQSSSYQKFNLIQYCKDHNIDFNRSMRSPKVVKNASDPRLRRAPLVIGVVEDDYDVPRMVVWSNLTNEMVVWNKVDFHGVRVSFGDMSWNRWIDYCSYFYIIEDDDIVPLYDDTEE